MATPWVLSAVVILSFCPLATLSDRDLMELIRTLTSLARRVRITLRPLSASDLLDPANYLKKAQRKPSAWESPMR